MTELIGGLYYEGEKIADIRTPHPVPIDRRWEQRKFEAKLVNPANHRKLDVIVVGFGPAGGAAAASLGEQGYNVKAFSYQDSVRRAYFIVAQGGISAAKNYRSDDDSIYRLFYDAAKGGNCRAREGNVYRLVEVSANITDQCVVQGVPFAREYGGLLDNRSFSDMQVSRISYARGQTGQQLLIGTYQAFERQVHAGTVKEFRRHEMVELVTVEGHTRGIVTRDMVSGKIETHLADTAVLASGGYGNVFLLSTNAVGCDAVAVWRAHHKGTYFINPYYTQIHPTCIPQSGDFQSRLTLMSESLRNDGRIWVSKKAEDYDEDPRDIPEEVCDYYLERIYPAFGNLVPRGIAFRQTKNMCDESRGVGPAIKEHDANGNEWMMCRGAYLDFSGAINRLGKDAISAHYGNLFEMYQRITGDDPYEALMRICPAVYYTMGDLWVDYNLESSVPGLYIAGEANFFDHGANRLGASALTQGLADGYFVLPDTMNDHLADILCLGKVDPNAPEIAEAKRSVEERVACPMALRGTRSVDDFHMALGRIMWEYCGMERCGAGPRDAIGQIWALREEFWRDARIMRQAGELNQALEKAGRLLDFFELTELTYIDALHRREPCGSHFRAEFQTPEGEALRHDDEFPYVAAWEWSGENQPPILHKEDLVYKDIRLKQRSYK